jgi:hypothetical protein
MQRVIAQAIKTFLYFNLSGIINDVYLANSNPYADLQNQGRVHT